MGACLSCAHVLNSKLPTAADFSLDTNFTVLKELGYGNEGKIYLIQERLTDGNHLFACKIIPRGWNIKPENVLKGLRNQSSLMFELIVQFHEVLLTKTHLIIKFEYVPGGDLYDYLCRQRAHSADLLLDEKHARFIFKQLLFAIRHCHKHRVAHRDITLANILCSKNKNPVFKICDFGLSEGWEASEDAKSFAGVGTLWFMSPEIIARYNDRTDEPYDPRKSDIWSLGVILYAMLLGRFPFLHVTDHNRGEGRSSLVAGSSASQSFLMREIEMALRLDPNRLSDEIQSMSFLSKQVKDLLLAMLTLDADNRIGLNEIKEHPWVNGSLSLKKAKVFTDIFWESGSGDVKKNLLASHVELVPGSIADKALENIVKLAVTPGSEADPILRWSPPAVRFHPDLTTEEIELLESEGIRRCSSCLNSHPDDCDYAKLMIKIEDPRRSK